MRKVTRKTMYLLAAAVTLVTAGAGGAAASYKKVTVDVDGKNQTFSGFQLGTVDQFLAAHGVRVTHGDLVQPDGHTRLTNGLHIHVHHLQEVSIQDGVKPQTQVKTVATTVAALLQQAGIHLNDADTLNVSLNDKPVNGMKIAITRRTEKVVTNDEAIPFQTERQPDSNAYKGQEKVLTPGVQGLAQITTTIYYENGKEVDRKSKKKTVKAPVNQVVAYGTLNQPVVVASRGSEDLLAAGSYTMVATAYSGGGNTASGVPAHVGTVAVDPNVIPLGTKLFIPGYGQAVAEDVGSAIQGDRIDLYFSSEQEARNFGRRTVNVFILH
ncbi:G5 domain-containing protein [Fodinisporobacter ferrooxydans]|uniref:G5 domain-containing protein n=1 Tax=Fodinisporobacter ferrooxydans TaxID=2901836 RepID=A0ABY4CI07_9BACL|nr:G5 domain-containing protein [Alicyclobacillaceae bacterium MYW30-H2]